MYARLDVRLDGGSTFGPGGPFGPGIPISPGKPFKNTKKTNKNKTVMCYSAAETCFCENHRGLPG